MTIQTDFIEAFNAIANNVHDTAKAKGWWDVQTAEEWIKKSTMLMEGLFVLVLQNLNIIT